MVELLAQVESLSGGAGWVGAGLLGAVLAWLLLKHLPAKDAQIERMVEGRDNLAEKLATNNREMVRELSITFREANAEVCKQMAAEREAYDRRHGEHMTEFRQIHLEHKESRHLLANLIHELRMSRAVREEQEKIEGG